MQTRIANFHVYNCFPERRLRCVVYFDALTFSILNLMTFLSILRFLKITYYNLKNDSKTNQITSIINHFSDDKRPV